MTSPSANRNSTLTTGGRTCPTTKRSRPAGCTPAWIQGPVGKSCMHAPGESPVLKSTLQQRNPCAVAPTRMRPVVPFGPATRCTDRSCRALAGIFAPRIGMVSTSTTRPRWSYPTRRTGNAVSATSVVNDHEAEVPGESDDGVAERIRLDEPGEAAAGRWRSHQVQPAERESTRLTSEVPADGRMPDPRLQPCRSARRTWRRRVKPEPAERRRDGNDTAQSIRADGGDAPDTIPGIRFVLDPEIGVAAEQRTVLSIDCVDIDP